MNFPTQPDTDVVDGVTNDLLFVIPEQMLNGIAYCRMLYHSGIPCDWVYLYTNPAFHAQTGIGPVAGKRASEVIPGIVEVDRFLVETYGRVASSGAPERFESFVASLNEWFSVQVYSPKAGDFVAVFDVITEKKKRENELREAQERLSLSQSASHSGVWDWNIRTGDLVWSDELIELFGLDPATAAPSSMPGGEWFTRTTWWPQRIERLTRRYAAEIFPLIGPEKDVPAPDVGTDAQIMAWIMDTYSQQVGYAVPGVVTGKPLSIGGSLGREEATGRGVVYVTLEALRHLNLPIETAPVAVQGFRNFGTHTARIMQQQGAPRVIAVSDVSGGIYNPKGIDIALLMRRDPSQPLHQTKLGDSITNEELLQLECTVLVPAALSEQITGTNADRLKCRILSEGANGPTTMEADRILADKGIFVIPDILANSGGVIVSYFEWVQDLQRFFWSAADIQNLLQDIITICLPPNPSILQRTSRFHENGGAHERD